MLQFLHKLGEFLWYLFTSGLNLKVQGTRIGNEAWPFQRILTSATPSSLLAC